MPVSYETSCSVRFGLSSWLSTRSITSHYYMRRTQSGACCLVRQLYTCLHHHLSLVLEDAVHSKFSESQSLLTACHWLNTFKVLLPRPLHGPCRHHERHRYSWSHPVPSNSYQPESCLSPLPPRKASTHYKLRPRQHDRQLIPKTTKLQL